MRSTAMARQGLMSALGLLALLIVLMPPVWLPPGTAVTTAIALVTIGLYATGLIAEAVTSLLFFLAAMLAAVAPADVVFSGFASSALWIIFGGLIIGLAVRHTGLGQTVADVLLTRIPARYGLLLLGAVMIGLVFAFLIPGSVARMVLLVPITVAVADRLGFANHANGRIALLLAVIFGTHTGSFAILPANTPNVVWSGAMESIHGLQIGYLEYLWWHFPVLGVLRSLLLVGLLVLWFPDRIPGREAQPPNADAMDARQRHMALVLLFALGFWATDVLHGIGPAWVALAAAVYLLFHVKKLVPEKPFAAIDIGPLLLVAGVLGLGELLAYSGVGEAAFTELLPHLPFSADQAALDYALVSLGGVGLAVMSAMPGVPAIGVPLGELLAEATGWSVKSVLIILTASYSTYLLPYQVPPILVGAQLARVPWGALTRFMLGFGLVSIAVIFPLHYLWLRLIGVL